MATIAVGQSRNTDAAIQKVSVSPEYIRDAAIEGYGDSKNASRAFSMTNGRISARNNGDGGSAEVQPGSTLGCQGVAVI